jgi:tetratricopeptide (TPR) repeat protein
MLKKLLVLFVVLAVTSQSFSRADDTVMGHYFEPLPTDSVKALLEKGYHAVKTQEDDAAMRSYQLVLKKGQPADCADAYIGIGNMYYGKKMYKESLASFDKAVALIKKLPAPLARLHDPNRGRAKVYLAMGDYKAALAAMNISMALGITDGRLAERAVILCKLNQYQQAIADYTALIKINPQDPHFYYSRAKCYESLGMGAEAARDKAAGGKATNDMLY